MLRARKRTAAVLALLASSALLASGCSSSSSKGSSSSNNAGGSGQQITLKIGLFGTFALLEPEGAEQPDLQRDLLPAAAGVVARRGPLAATAAAPGCQQRAGSQKGEHRGGSLPCPEHCLCLLKWTARGGHEVRCDGVRALSFESARGVRALSWDCSEGALHGGGRQGSVTDSLRGRRTRCPIWPPAPG